MHGTDEPKQPQLMQCVCVCVRITRKYKTNGICCDLYLCVYVCLRFHALMVLITKGNFHRKMINSSLSPFSSAPSLEEFLSRCHIWTISIPERSTKTIGNRNSQSAAIRKTLLRIIFIPSMLIATLCSANRPVNVMQTLPFAHKFWGLPTNIGLGVLLAPCLLSGTYEYPGTGLKRLFHFKCAGNSKSVNRISKSLI